MKKLDRKEKKNILERETIVQPENSKHHTTVISYAV